MIGPVAFAAPWLLLALLALPLLWLLLRAVPPAPVRRMFPGVVLLLGLRDDDSVSDKTPWWLLLLRLLAVAAIIIGLAGPVLNPDDESAASSAPLLIISDASWASAPDWPDRLAMMDAALSRAARQGRSVALVRLSAPETPVFQAANRWAERLVGLEPSAWTPTDAQVSTLVDAIAQLPAFDTLWLSDGLARDNRTDLLTALRPKGAISVVENGQPVQALRPVEIVDGAIQVTALRSAPGPEQGLSVQAIGRDPSGVERALSQFPIDFDGGEITAETALILPAELRARITRFQIAGLESAGAVALGDDRLRRREVALIIGRENREGLELLSPLHYLQRALAPTADLLEGAIDEVLPANPDVIVLADIAALTEAEQTALTTWIDDGGLLLRFAGPRLAASEISRREEHPLMPVRLRAGGRSVGGAMSWGAPKSLAPFDKDSPFFGLPVPDEVSVIAQVVAQPDPTLAARTIARLSDGTPLVTRKEIGRGQVILFHVTANAEWSSLPLSGLFVSMLERLSITSASGPPSPEDMAGTIWQPRQILDGFGHLHDGQNLPGIDGATLLETRPGPNMPPGLYDGPDRSMAVNLLRGDDTLAPSGWPPNIAVRNMTRTDPVPLGGWLLALALILLALDVLATLALGGRLRKGVGVAACLLLALPLGVPTPGRADDTDAIAATSDVVLAHVLTGDTLVDDTALAGLRGLSDTLFFRTSIEPAQPMSVNLETDDLGFFPLLYWPITANQRRPSSQAYDKLNRYIRNGGMILFDTRDGNIAGYGAASPEGRTLRQLAAPLDIPALEPVPQDHVLTRAFYLLQQFPGRHTSRDVWVEAAPPDAQRIEGMPFRNLNDGVTPVVIGGNDWAAAWAVSTNGAPMFPVGRGLGGERQRELAYRFGVNLVMHVLTGNYKSDQVHVPALLERLGQ